MGIDGFIRLPDIIDKLARKHRLEQDEAEEVFFNRPRYWFVERGRRKGENVYAATGQTDSGRYVRFGTLRHRVLHLEGGPHRLDPERPGYGRKGAEPS